MEIIAALPLGTPFLVLPDGTRRIVSDQQILWARQEMRTQEIQKIKNQDVASGLLYDHLFA